MACSSVDFPKYDDHGQMSWSLSPVPKAVQFGGMWRLLSDIWIKLKEALWGLRAAKLQVRIYEPCLLLLPSFDHITCITSNPFKNSDGRKMVSSSAGCHKIRSGSHICLLARGQFRKPSSWPHMWYLLSPYRRASRATLVESSKSSTASSARLRVYKPCLRLFEPFFISLQRHYSPKLSVLPSYDLLSFLRNHRSTTWCLYLDLSSKTPRQGEYVVFAFDCQKGHLDVFMKDGVAQLQKRGFRYINPIIYLLPLFSTSPSLFWNCLESGIRTVYGAPFCCLPKGLEWTQDISGWIQVPKTTAVGLDAVFFLCCPRIGSRRTHREVWLRER
jgi:hypothetical protein